MFLNFSGDPGRREILVKDRYWNFWIFDRDLKLLWSGQGSLGHYPFAYADPASGRDQLAIGYSLWDGIGQAALVERSEAAAARRLGVRRQHHGR